MVSSSTSLVTVAQAADSSALALSPQPVSRRPFFPVGRRRRSRPTGKTSKTSGPSSRPRTSTPRSMPFWWRSGAANELVCVTRPTSWAADGR